MSGNSTTGFAVGKMPARKPRMGEIRGHLLQDLTTSLGFFLSARNEKAQREGWALSTRNRDYLHFEVLDSPDFTERMTSFCSSIAALAAMWYTARLSSTDPWRKNSDIVEDP
jgi:hypothetical protein